MGWRNQLYLVSVSCRRRGDCVLKSGSYSLSRSPYTDFWAWALWSPQSKMSLGVCACLRSTFGVCCSGPLKINLIIIFYSSPRTWITSWQFASVSVKSPCCYFTGWAVPSRVFLTLLTAALPTECERPLVEMADSPIYCSLELPAAPQVQDDSRWKLRGESGTSAVETVLGGEARGITGRRECRVRTLWGNSLGWICSAVWTVSVERSCLR